MTSPARRVLDQAMSEADWQRTVTDLAETLGWRVYHTYDSRRSEPGFPDLVLARPGDRVIFAELKRETGRRTDDQASWWWTLERADAEVYVWRPSDYPEVEEALRPKRTPPARGVPDVDHRDGRKGVRRVDVKDDVL